MWCVTGLTTSAPPINAPQQIRQSHKSQGDQQGSNHGAGDAARRVAGRLLSQHLLHHHQHQQKHDLDPYTVISQRRHGIQYRRSYVFISLKLPLMSFTFVAASRSWRAYTRHQLTYVHCLSELLILLWVSSVPQTYEFVRLSSERQRFDPSFFKKKYLWRNSSSHLTTNNISSHLFHTSLQAGSEILIQNKHYLKSLLPYAFHMLHLHLSDILSTARHFHIVTMFSCRKSRHLLASFRLPVQRLSCWSALCFTGGRSTHQAKLRLGSHTKVVRLQGVFEGPPFLRPQLAPGWLVRRLVYLLPSGKAAPVSMQSPGAVNMISSMLVFSDNLRTEERQRNDRGRGMRNSRPSRASPCRVLHCYAFP